MSARVFKRDFLDGRCSVPSAAQQRPAPFCYARGLARAYFQRYITYVMVHISGHWRVAWRCLVSTRQQRTTLSHTSPLTGRAGSFPEFSAPPEPARPIAMRNRNPRALRGLVAIGSTGRIDSPSQQSRHQSNGPCARNPDACRDVRV